MKFFLFCLACLTAFIFPGSLPDARAQRFVGGFDLGLTASEVSGDQAGGPDKAGLYLSAFVFYPLSDHSRLQVEIMYVQKGSRAFHDPFLEKMLKDGSPQDGYRDYKLNLHYVEVPVLFQSDLASVTQLPYVDRLSLEAGLSVARVVGHYEQELGKDITAITAMSKPFRPAELNVLMGLYYPVSSRLSFHLRFSQGITPFRPHQGGSKTWYNRGQYNTVWSFGLAFYFLTDGELLISR